MSTKRIGSLICVPLLQFRGREAEAKCGKSIGLQTLPVLNGTKKRGAEMSPQFPVSSTSYSASC
jgi:hypothetical protein